MHPLNPVSLQMVETARQRIAAIARRTPLLPFSLDPQILLKLESLQPIGSFKIRGAANAMLSLPRSALDNGVYTASAGNMAQGVAWCARELGVRCQVIVPDSAPEVKRDAVRRLGGEVIPVPFDEWWQVMVDHGMPGMSGHFVHPFADSDVMAGNATIGLELHADAPRLTTVLVPWGGGGLACGIASALRAVAPHVRVHAVEVSGASPLAASFAAGHATSVTPVRSFVDGIGGRSVSAEMWPIAQGLLAGIVEVTVAEVASAVRELACHARVVAEGAGAAAFAAARSGRVTEAGTMACIVSGGNINPEKLSAILAGANA